MYRLIYTIPSAVPERCTETLRLWKQMGYETAVLIDGDTESPGYADHVLRVPEYLGYGWATNELMRLFPDAEVCIGGGDDNEPDLNHDPQKIAHECFVQANNSWFFCMQPTGDEFLDRSINHFCGSPWLGRDFRRRASGGSGLVYHEAYFHY